jgi:glycosyltransferase involved in cell wall biosynthesis
VARIALNSPDVSVVIPTRDRWTLAEATVRSALAQEGPSVEVVLIDDGSATPAPDSLRALGDGLVHVHRNERSHGPAGARNAGIEHSHGQWIAFLDDDDLWSPHKLREQLDAARSAWVYSRAVLFSAKDRVACEAIAFPVAAELPRVLVRRNVLPAGSSNVIVRRDLVRSAGGFDARLSQLSDWELWLRLAASERPTSCDETHVAYRRHAGNMIVSHADPHEELTLIAHKHAALAAALGEKFDPVALAHWLAAEQRRVGRRRDAFFTHLRAARRLRDARHLLSAVRVPLGDRAMALRERRPVQVPAPDWLLKQLS